MRIAEQASNRSVIVPVTRSGSRRRQARARKNLFLTEPAIPVKKGCWSAGSEKDEVSFEAFLVDDSSAFERGKDGALGLRQAKAGFDKRVDHEGGIDGKQELFKAGALK
jgi:hypothetical protein